MPRPARAAPAAVRQHLLRQRPLRRRVRRGRPRRGPGASATTTSRPSSRPSCSSARRWPTACPRRSTARASWSATRAPARPRSTTAPTSSRPSCVASPGSPLVPAVGDRDAVQGVPGAARLRDRRDGRAVGARRARSGRTYALTDPHPPTVRELVDDLRRPPRQARGLGAAAAAARPALLVGSVPGHGAAARACRPRRWTTSPRRRRTPRPTPSPTSQGTGVQLPAVRVVRRPAARLHARAPRDRLRGDGLSPTGTRGRAPPVTRPRPTPDDTRSSSTSASPAPTATTTSRSPSWTATFRIVRVGHRRRRRRAASAGRATGRPRRRDRRHRHPRGPRRGLYDGDLEAVEQVMRGRRRRAGHRRPRPARRAAGVGDPARADRDAGLLQQRPHGGARRRNHDRTARVLREYTAQPRVRRPAAAPRTCRRRCDSRPARSGSRRRRRLAGAPAARRGRGAGSRAPGQRARATRWPARRRATATSSWRPTTSSTGFGLEDLAGKTVVTSAISDERLAELAARGVDLVLDARRSPSTSPSPRPCSRR